MSCETKKITVKVAKINHIDYATGCTKEMCCDMEIRGTFWKTPLLTIDGLIDSYTYTTISNDDGTEAAPTADSYKVVKVDACGDAVEVVIANDQTAQIIKDACNVCCGESPIEFTATIPAPIIEIKPCEDADGNRKVSIAYPTGTLVFAATAEGVDISPAPAASYANAAAIKTAWDADWTAYGTMAHDATTKVLTVTLATGVESLGMQVTTA